MTIIRFGTLSNISPKRVKLQTSNLVYWCMWTISPKWTNKISDKGRGLGHVTLIKFGTLSKYVSKTSKSTDFKFGVPMHVDNFSKRDK